MNKTPKKKSCDIIQNHHLSYEPEHLVKMSKTEHWLITSLNRHTVKISMGFLQALANYIVIHWGEAIKL